MLQLDLNNFEDEILEASEPCIVTFKREACHLCKGLTPVMERLSHRYKYKFAIIDCDGQPELINLFEVEGVPTVFVFIDGNGSEVEYPEHPNMISGYSEAYLIRFLEEIKNV